MARRNQGVWVASTLALPGDWDLLGNSTVPLSWVVNTASFRVEWPLGVCLEHWDWVILGLCWDDLRKTKEKSCHGIEVSAHGTDGTHAINVWRGRISYSDLGGPLPCLTHPHCWPGCAGGWVANSSESIIFGTSEEPNKQQVKGNGTA